MSVARPPFITSIQSPNYYTGNRVVEAVVWHISVGTLASNLSWLTSPLSEASSTFLIARDGRIYLLVPLHLSPWTNGKVNNPDLSNPLIAKWVREGINPNYRTVTIEFEGYSSYGRGGSLTQEQINSGTWTTAYVLDQYKKPANRTHIIGHYQIDNVDRPYCPGFSTEEWARMVNKTANILASGYAPLVEPKGGALEIKTPYGTFWIVNDPQAPMLDYYNKEGGLFTFGYPIGGMSLHSDGVFRQPFEFGILESWPKGTWGKPGPTIKPGGIPQNWHWYRPILEAARQKARMT